MVFNCLQVSRQAFGAAGGYCTIATLLTLTLFVLIAYMILVRDIWSGLLQLAYNWCTGG
jgi:hypothetical protein